MKCEKTIKLIAALLMVPLFAFSQVQLMKPQQFKKSIPAGNYSGIVPLGQDRYAVVSDKSPADGFFVFRLRIDTLKGRIVEAENEGFLASGMPNRDMEGIAYCPDRRTIFVSGETDNEVYEYTLSGQRSGRRLEMPECFRQARHNLGLEALCYDTLSHRFFTTSERVLKGDSLLRIQAFDDSLMPVQQYLYRPDKPISRKYYDGVSALCATGDGRLLVLERQIRVPRLKIGAKTVIRIYEVCPGNVADGDILEKRLLVQFTTRFGPFSRRFANYEGLCMPFPGFLLLIADSQNQYKGVLRDWFRMVKILDNAAW